MSTYLMCRRCLRRRKADELFVPSYFYVRNRSEERHRMQCKAREDCDAAIEKRLEAMQP